MKIIIGVGKQSGESVWIDVTGLEELDAVLKNIPELVKAEARKELQVSLADLKGEAQRRAPIELGDLRGSAFYETSWNGDNLEGIVGFVEPYALRQHEEMDYNHPQGGGPKYLENPFKERIGTYTQNIADATKKALP